MSASDQDDGPPPDPPPDPPADAPADAPATPPPKGRVSHAQVLQALEVRYDHLSARNVLREALQRAQMKPAPDYSPEEASRLVWGLAEVGPKAQKAIMRLLEFTGAAATHDVVPDPEEEEERLFWN